MVAFEGSGGKREKGRRRRRGRRRRAAREPGAQAPFILTLAIRQVRRICEIDVEHAPRGHGTSRCGWLGLLGLQARFLATLARPRRR